MCLLCFIDQVARIQYRVIRLRYFRELMLKHRSCVLTFMTTCRSFSARILGANSEPRKASRLYRA